MNYRVSNTSFCFKEHLSLSMTTLSDHLRTRFDIYTTENIKDGGY